VRLAAAVVLAAVLASAGWSAGTTPPVIREPFIPLPCPMHPASTIEIEGCQERALLASDRSLNVLLRKIFVKLRGGARPGFGQSEAAWLAYRRRSCMAESSPAVGGTANSIEFLACEVQRDETHGTDLGRLLAAVSVH
jgi:uncharacterized protein YecT (DUF1311 family)